VYKYLLKVSGVLNIYHDHCYNLVNHDGIVSQSSDVTHESTRYKPESLISPSNDDTLLLPSPKRIKVCF